MGYFYSPSAGGFYISGQPSDAVAISDEQHALLLQGEAQGMRIVPGEGGAPVLQARLPPSYLQELSDLNAEWQTKVDGYNKSFTLAVLSDGPSEESKKAAIRASYEEAKQQNSAERNALKIKYGIGDV